jgi:hypothetical protein
MYNQPTMLPQLSPMSGMTLTAAGQPQQQQQQQQAFQQQQQLLQQALQPSVNLKSSPVKAANATQQKHKLPSPPSQPQPSRQSPRRRSSEYEY